MLKALQVHVLSIFGAFIGISLCFLDHLPNMLRVSIFGVPDSSKVLRVSIFGWVSILQ